MKVLHDRSGTYEGFGTTNPYNPIANHFEDRPTIRDPRTGRMVSMTRLNPVYSQARLLRGERRERYLISGRSARP